MSLTVVMRGIMETRGEKDLSFIMLASLGSMIFLSFAFWLLIVMQIDMPVILTVLGMCCAAFVVWAIGWFSGMALPSLSLVACTIIGGTSWPILDFYATSAYQEHGQLVWWGLWYSKVTVLCLIPVVAITLYKRSWKAALPAIRPLPR